MGRSAESCFKAAVVKALREEGIFVQVVESRGTGCGIPDLYIAPNIWVELKAEIDTAWPSAKKIAFQPLQLSWLVKADLHGAVSVVMAKFANRVVALPAWILDRSEPHFIVMVENRYSLPRFDAKEFMEWVKRQSTIQRTIRRTHLESSASPSPST